MSNIQKSFRIKAKRSVCMAGGGVVGLDTQFDPNGRVSASQLELMDSAPKVGLFSATPTELSPNTQAGLGNYRYKAGGVGDPHASGGTFEQEVQRAGLRQQLQPQPAKPVVQLPDAGIGQRSAGLERLKTPGFADGLVDRAKNIISSRGAQLEGQLSAQEQPAPVAAPVGATVQTMPSQAADYAAQAAAIEREQAEAARARMAAPKPKKWGLFAQGGVATVSGPGTGTSDSIPLTLRQGSKKADIRVSNGEGLCVLPKKTMDDPEAVDIVNNVIRETNGKEPKGLRAGGHYVDGLEASQLIDDEVRARAAQARTLSPTNAPSPSANMAPNLEFGEAKPAGQPASVMDKAKSVGQKGVDAVKSGLNAAKDMVKPTPAPEIKWWQPSEGVKSITRGGMKAARSAFGSPLLAAYGIHEAAQGFSNQNNRDASDIDSRGGFLASSAKDAFPMLSAFGGAIGNKTAKIVNSLSGGVDPDAGRKLSLGDAILSSAGPDLSSLVQENSKREPTQVAAKTAPASVTTTHATTPPVAPVDSRFEPDVKQLTPRSGSIRIGQPTGAVFGSSQVDATKLSAPNGGGYITGKDGRAVYLPAQATPARDPNKEYDRYGNDMTATNAMKASLREMQRDRILRTAAMPNATEGDLRAAQLQMHNDAMDVQRQTSKANSLRLAYDMIKDDRNYKRDVANDKFDHDQAVSKFEQEKLEQGRADHNKWVDAMSTVNTDKGPQIDAARKAKINDYITRHVNNYGVDVGKIEAKDRKKIIFEGMLADAINDNNGWGTSNYKSYVKGEQPQKITGLEGRDVSFETDALGRPGYTIKGVGWTPLTKLVGGGFFGNNQYDPELLTYLDTLAAKTTGKNRAKVEGR